MLKKFLLGLVALFLILMGSLILIMGYVFNNPDTVFHAFNSVTEKFMQGQKYEEAEEFFLQGIETLRFSSRRVDVHVKTFSERNLKVVLHGKVPRFENGPFILQTVDKDNLNIEFQEPLASHWIEMNVNGEETTQASDAQLVADIYVPESYKGRLLIETRQGHVQLQLPTKNLYEVDLQSVSGKIQNNLNQKPTSEILPQEVGHIKVQTIEGSITVEPQD